MISVEVGPQHDEYKIHREVLVYHSEYFRAALQGCWTENKERKVIIEDLEPAAFNIFVDWLYTRRIPSTVVAWGGSQEDGDNFSYSCRVSLLFFQTYVLADRLGAQELLNAVNNWIVGYQANSSPWYDTVIYAFDNIPAARRILSMLVESHCRYSEEDDDALHDGDHSLHTQLPNDFLFRVMKRYRQICEDRDWDREMNLCDYHEHVSEEERQKCKRKAEEDE